LPLAAHAITGSTINARALFDAAGVDGTMVIHDVRQQRTLTYNPERAATAYSPASTFKVFNSLIALETGAAADVDNDKLPWDGKVMDAQRQAVSTTGLQRRRVDARGAEELVHAGLSDTGAAHRHRAVPQVPAPRVSGMPTSTVRWTGSGLTTS
jgi:hypothetical protein